ncbi:hypothetical protein ACSNOH_13115 [Streptomyces sp. URMC 127]|uniref:hypothetical protein n=1 Tax=Streptomyces sp. URMC 127 TaxID=3423402 RepID=UPI003F198959
MATDPSTALQGIDPDAWEQLARTANEHKKEGQADTTADEIKQLYIEGAQRVEDRPLVVQAPEVRTEPVRWEEKWREHLFDLGPLEFYALCHLKFDNEEWALKLGVGADLSGRNVWWEGIDLSASLTSYTWTINLKILQGSLTVGVRRDDSNNCWWFYVAGELCYWWGGWKCPVKFKFDVFWFR